ncbi:MAG TPA: phosphoribosyltransferase family protein [Rhizomicrobium sp.]|jgi:putative phosphoribosyl transferase
MAKDRFAFHDRNEAGRWLAPRVAALKPERPLVLALPRGGVPVAVEIARALRAPLDLLLVRKIGLPWQPELALGAVTDGRNPRTVVNEHVAQASHVDAADIARIAQIQLAEIARRHRIWMGARDHIPLAGRTVILVDDGVATGASVRVALEAVKAERPARIVLALPVVSDFAAEGLRAASDDAIFLLTPDDLAAVGTYYRDFHQLDDDEVTQLLHNAWASLPAG